MQRVTTRKISLTLSEDLLEDIREKVGPRGTSKYVDHAVRAWVEADRRAAAFDRFLAKLDETDPPSEQDRALARKQVDSILGAPER